MGGGRQEVGHSILWLVFRVEPVRMHASMSKESVLQAVVEYLAADVLRHEETILRLEQEKRELVEQLADQAFERAAFGVLAERWLVDVGTSRKAIDKIRGELNRYTASQFANV
jgi:F0F1-type ATP synthase gamma subunit